MDKENKEITIGFRVTPREAALIEKAARKRNFTTSAFMAALGIIAAKTDDDDERRLLAGITSSIPIDDLPQFLREMQASMGLAITEIMERFIEAVALPMAAEYETRLATVRAMAQELEKLNERTAKAIDLANEQGKLYAKAREKYLEAKNRTVALARLQGDAIPAPGELQS